MQPLSSQVYASESSPAKKTKTQSQREYRSKETDGFSELRNALLLVDPFDTALGRDTTRHQLLIAAAKKLRNLADEKEKLVLKLSAIPTTGSHEPDTRSPCGMTAQNVAAPGVVWSNQGADMQHSQSMASMTSPPFRDYENPGYGWIESPPPVHGNVRQSYDVALESSYRSPLVTGMRRFH